MRQPTTQSTSQPTTQPTNQPKTPSTNPSHHHRQVRHRLHLNRHHHRHHHRSHQRDYHHRHYHRHRHPVCSRKVQVPGLVSYQIGNSIGAFVSMVLICENVHPKSLNFANQRKVMMLRDVQNMPFSAIRLQVRNLQNKHPSTNLVCRLYLCVQVFKALLYMSEHSTSHKEVLISHTLHRQCVHILTTYHEVWNKTALLMYSTLYFRCQNMQQVTKRY